MINFTLNPGAVRMLTFFGYTIQIMQIKIQSKINIPVYNIFIAPYLILGDNPTIFELTNETTATFLLFLENVSQKQNSMQKSAFLK